MSGRWCESVSACVGVMTKCLMRKLATMWRQWRMIRVLMNVLPQNIHQNSNGPPLTSRIINYSIARTINFNLKTKLEKVALDATVECCAPPPMVWPWTLTFWPQNLIRSSLSRDAPVTKVWRKSVNRYWRYRGNIKLPRESRTDGRTDGRTHGRTIRKHIASNGAYRRRRLKKLIVWKINALIVIGNAVISQA